MIVGPAPPDDDDAAGTAVTDTDVLIDDWCQQFPSHSLGSLDFGPEGALYVTGGDGASFNGPDYGQAATVFGARVRHAGGDPSPPQDEGGALRSQDIRTTGDPIGPQRRGPPDQPRHRGRRGRATQLRHRADPTPRRSSPTACATRSA